MPRRKTPEQKPHFTDLTQAYRSLSPAEFLKMVGESPADSLRLNIDITEVNEVVLLGFISAIPAERREIIVRGGKEDLEVLKQRFPRLLEYVKLEEIS